MSFICLKIFEEVRFFVLKNVPSTGFRAGTHNPLAVDQYRSFSPWSIRNQTAQQEVSSRPVNEASSVFIAAPYHSPITPRWNSLVPGKQAQGSH